MVEEFKSSDGITIKYRFNRNGQVLEVAHVCKESKHIICFPSQIGCKINCKFCMANDFVRNLRAEEMIELCNYVLSKIPFDNKPILLSCMGVGEPSFNAESLALVFNYFFKIKDSFSFTVSTLAVDYDGVMSLINNPINIKFLFSIHAIESKQRKKIFGFNPPLQNILNLLKHRYDLNAEFNYMLIEGLNDSIEDAKALSNMINKIGNGNKYLIKLNRFNPIPGCNFHPSSNVKIFTETLQNCGTNFEIYETDGTDINAACGQLLGGEY